MLRRILLASGGALVLTGAAAAANSEERPPPPNEERPPPSPPNWDGFYTGMNVGGAFGSPAVFTQSINVFDAYGPETGETEALASALSQTGYTPLHTGGVIGGGQIGYNFQFYNNFVVGIETDINGLSQRGRGSFAKTTPDDPIINDFANAVVSSEKAVDWLGTVRGRLGWLVTPTFLIYGDGGLAYGGVRGSTHVHAFWTPGGLDTAGDAWTDASGSLSATRVGWTAGGGLEWMFMPNWSLKIEYLYYDLGHATWANSPNSAFSTITIDAIGAAAGTINATNISTSTTRFTGNIVRAGLNYHFNWGAPPVVAKY
jgi:outer membrane immunogenic protein